MKPPLSSPAPAPAPDPAPARRWPPWTWVFVGLALALFLLLAGVVVYRNRQPFDCDLAVSQAVQGLSWGWFAPLMRGVSQADNDAPGAGLLIGGACLVLGVRRAWRETAVLLGVVGAGLILWIATGQIVGRPRPTLDRVQVLIAPNEVEGFSSFPSGHAVHYTVFFGFLWFLTLTRVALRALCWPLLGVFGGLVLLVGLARIYLGAHWFSDVAGGYLLGSAILATGIHLYRRGARPPGERVRG